MCHSRDRVNIELEFMLQGTMINISTGEMSATSGPHELMHPIT